LRRRDLTVEYGQIYAEFSRSAPSLKDAILSAIRDIRKAGHGLNVLRVDECDLVTQADIARRIGKTRQLVSMYIAGVRGPGGFPAPSCHWPDHSPMWTWCSVSYWLLENDMIRPEKYLEAEVVGAINFALEHAQRKVRNPKLVDEVIQAVEAS
jgi:hypothetical protein